MNLFIIVMDDPIQTKLFIRKIIHDQKNNIKGLAITEGDRLKIHKSKSKIKYLISLFLIMSFYNFVKNSIITIIFKINKKLSKKYPVIFKNPSIKTEAEKYGIKTWEIKTPNQKEFLEEIQKLEIDIIINQSQNILKKELLAIPKIGVINRHNALLPKNRGRLTPFWVLFKEERETGVSIHFVTEEIDAGDIIIQKRFVVENNDNFNKLVKKNYKFAYIAMKEALDKLERGDKNYLKNDSNYATYNTIPTLKEAWKFRKRRILKKCKLI